MYNMSVITSVHMWNECSTPVQLCLVLWLCGTESVGLSLLQIRDHMNTALALLCTTLSPEQFHTKSICICCCNHLDFVQLVTNQALKTCFLISPARSLSFIVSWMFHFSILIYFLCLTEAYVMISQIHYL